LFERLAHKYGTFRGRSVGYETCLPDSSEVALFSPDLKGRAASEALDWALIIVVGVVQIHLKAAAQTVDFHVFSSKSPLRSVS
jgi:hypothetical protein